MKQIIQVVTLSILLSSYSFAEDEKTVAIQGVITAQLTAFLNKDPRAAWVHAHPSIKAQFNTPEKFIEMVERGYSPMMDFVELEFRTLEYVEDMWVQTLLLRDSKGDRYDLLYVLIESQPDRFQIAGVSLEPNDGI